MRISRRGFLQLGSLPLLAPLVSRLPAQPTGRARARELGVTIGRLRPGRWNAITDVPGVEVGHTTLIRGSGPLVVGEGPVRTGVTVIRPRRDIVETFLPCGFDAPNGNGELTGRLQARGLGVLSSPIGLTNTSSVGTVYAALAGLQPDDEMPAGVPVVGETWDAFLNDVEGRHVKRDHVLAALDSAASGPVAEGAVGGGTGMICYDFKGGIGTASRQLPPPLERYSLGALVQANHGERALLRIDGVAIGEAISGDLPSPAEDYNSIIIVIATDAPLLAHQLDRLARRAVHGLAKTGSISGNSSGDFAFAFSTANPIPRGAFWRGDGYRLASLEQFDIQPLFEAAAEAVEEAIVNALFMAVDMDGIDEHVVRALPIDATLALLERAGRLRQSTR